MVTDPRHTIKFSFNKQVLLDLGYTIGENVYGEEIVYLPVLYNPRRESFWPMGLGGEDAGELI